MMLLFRNPRFLALTLILMIFVGLASFRLMPNSEDPELIPRFISITTRWPGANAERMDSLVTEKIEQKLEEVEELKELRSISVSGFSFVGVIFKDNVTGERLERAVTRSQEKLSQVQPELPPDAGIPELNDNLIGTITLIAAVTWQDESPVQPVLLRRYAEELSDVLRRVPGTNFVRSYGSPTEEVIVEARSEELNALGISVDQLAATIRGSDAKVLAGQIQNESNDVIIEVGGEFETVDEIRQIPIATGPQGRVIWLSDIATVTKGVADPPREMAIIDGHRGIAVVAQMEIENRIEVWTSGAMRSLEQYAEQLPAGLKLEILFEQNLYTQERLADLAFNLIVGILLVFAATFVMMGWRSSVVVAAALPLSVLMTLAGMNIVGLGIHQMSIIGLIIALGLLIDNAIIIVDEITRKLHAGKKTEQAISESIGHLGLPLLGSTLTTIFAFTPLALMPGPVGDFCRAMAIAVILALSSSLLISLTLIPVLVGILNARANHDGRHSILRAGVSSAPFLSRYTQFLKFVHGRPWLPIFAVPLLSCAGFACVTLLSQEFFPFSDRDQFPIQIWTGANGSLEKTERDAMAVRERIMKHPEVKCVHWFVGTNSPNFFYSMGGGSDGSPNYAHGLVQLHSSRNVNDFIIDLQRELDEAFPDIYVLSNRLGHASKPEAAIAVDVVGPDLDRLREIGEEIRTLFASIPGVRHTRVSLVDGQPKYVFASSEEEMQVARLSNVSVAQQLNSSMTGAFGGSLFEDTEEAPIRVRLATPERRDLNMVTSVNLPTVMPVAGNVGTGTAQVRTAAAGSRWVPLSGLGQMELVPGVYAIPRQDGQRSNTISAFVPPESNVSSLGAFYKDELEAIRERLPAGYSLQTGGEEENQSEGLANVLAYVGLLMVIMVASLVVGMKSFRLMMIIACVGIMSMGSGFAALAAFDIAFGFSCVVGLVGLIGVAINDSIVVLAALHDDERVRRGDLDAACEVIVGSTRHVLATSLTTMAGLLPLIVSSNQLWQPMGVVIGGGVFAATGLALVFAPAAYLLIMPTIRGFEGMKPV